jgi:hypothetical protein
MYDYRVAAVGPRFGNVDGQEPDGRRHAYLVGGRATACGVGLDVLRRYEHLVFGRQSPGTRCPQCARVVGSTDH